MDDEELALDQRSIVAWRLGKLEAAVSQLAAELKIANEIRTTVALNAQKIESLETSRANMVKGFWGLAVMVVGSIVLEVLRYTT